MAPSRPITFVALVAASLSLTGCELLGAPQPVAAPVAEEAAAPCAPEDRERLLAACADGDGAQCNVAGAMFEHGLCAAQDPEHGAADAASAAAYYRRACEVSFAQGCNNLGWLYLLGRGVEQEPRHAMKLFTRAFDAYRQDCARGDPSSCVLAGSMLLEGRGAEPDDALALSLFDRACTLGNQRGCAESRALR